MSETILSYNNDAIEGGFDALIQVILCKETIGWRKNSKKLIVFSTDAGYHYAGDGKVRCTKIFKKQKIHQRKYIFNVTFPITKFN